MARFGSVGRGFGRLGAPSKSELGPHIVLDTTDVPEQDAEGQEVFTASISGEYTGTPAWSLSGIDNAYFSIHATTGVVTLDASLDYDNELQRTKYITIAVADITPLPTTNPRAFTINVTNVLEVTLAALTLDDANVSLSASVGDLVGTLQDVSSGSTLSLIDTDGNQFALDGEDIEVGVGTLIEGVQSITVRETHPDASNSPRDSIIAITVAEAAGNGAEFNVAENSYYIAVLEDF
jgi:hypothetical protein